ncbi:MAG: alkaline phosphatase D family protein [Verrucomicrobiota bacterium]
MADSTNPPHDDFNDSRLPGRRGFLKGGIGLLAVTTLAGNSEGAPVNDPKAPLPTTVGPILGHVDEKMVCVFIRPEKPGKVTLIVKKTNGQDAAKIESEATEANDLCIHFRVENLQPGTKYAGAFFGEDEKMVFADAKFFVTTPDAPNRQKRVVLAMGSCVSSTSYDELWKTVEDERPDGFCLLGDTPYIDSNDLTRNRHARRIFWGTLPTLKDMARRIPFWNTWDDHDFGKNDSDGRMPKKENIRKAFMEYNALANYGENDAGIYTTFRRGPVEVWLIDDRWFSQTGPSWADPAQKTCLGTAQWEWLKRTLKASTAPFKILCTGMTWYPKGNKEKDHWETYFSEREAIYSYIKDQKIPGVVLVSGDIHVSRHHDYGKERLGYPLHECVVSPLHHSVIPSLDIPHPARVWSKPEPHAFMTLEATERALRATWINKAGKKIHKFDLSSDELTPKA